MRFLWLTWPELALNPVMRVATRVAVVPTHRPSRGLPRRAHAAQQLLHPHGGLAGPWSVAGFPGPPPPLLGFCGGEGQAQGV